MKPISTCIRKPLSLAAALLFFSTMSFGQLTQGDIAPNFTYPDIEGNSHTLYDYLDEGYSVFITMSATWCGPCWGFHQSGTKSSLWANHGPAGAEGVSDNTTDDLVVLFIEGDPQTTLANLNGSGSTQGDWVTGTNYPIIDIPNSQLTSSYGLTGFPNSWLVCPDRRIKRYYSGYSPTNADMTAAAIYAESGSCAVATEPNDPAVMSFSMQNETCGAADITFTLQNMGLEELTSCNIEMRVNGMVEAEVAWSGSLATYATELIDLGTIEYDEVANVEIEIVSADDNPDNNSIEFTLTTPATNTAITVSISLDSWPDETTWNIKNEGGQTVASGGPYAQSQANTTVTQEVLLDSDGCYSFTILDDFGDGLYASQWGNFQNGSVLISDSEGNVVYSYDGTYNFSEESESFSAASALSANENKYLAGVNLFPNPTSGILNISFSLLDFANTSVHVSDITGKLVMSEGLGTLGEGQYLRQLDLSRLQKGLYVVNFTTGDATSAFKVVLTQ
jgi:hypothetical protein